MSYSLPQALLNAIEEIGRLPGVGARTAERYAYFLLKSNEQSNQCLADAIINLKSGIKICPITFALINDDEEISTLYSDSNRNKKQIAIVEDPLDIVPLERTGQYTGTYHVLGGALSPIDNIGPDQLHIAELITRLTNDSVDEVIIATNASVEGESTAIFLAKELHDIKPDLKVTRLARGLPIGVDLEYADQITLTHALEGRRQV